MGCCFREVLKFSWGEVGLIRKLGWIWVRIVKGKGFEVGCCLWRGWCKGLVIGLNLLWSGVWGGFVCWICLWIGLGRGLWGGIVGGWCGWILWWRSLCGGIGWLGCVVRWWVLLCSLGWIGIWWGFVGWIWVLNSWLIWR